MNKSYPDAHRPWPVPRRPWIMKQTWLDLLFAHWPVRYDKLRELVPPALQLETYDGYAWIGIVPFRMEHIHWRGLPPFPYTSAFPELNVRTYVRVGDKPGVYFFSLDAANHFAVQMAKRFFYLRYFYAVMRVHERDGWHHYASRRKHVKGTQVAFEGAYRPTSPDFLSSPDSFDHWLTERYCLYSVDKKHSVWRGEIHHQPWTLQKAETEILINTMASSQGIELIHKEPVLHFSKHLEVQIGPIVRAYER